MPITITQLDNGYGNLIKGEGIVTGQEFYTAMKELAEKPDEQLKKYRYSISDYTEITDSNVELPFLYKGALVMDDFSGKNKNILIGVAASDPIAYSLAKLYSHIAKLTGWEFGVFRKRDYLDEWLIEKLGDQCQELGLKFDKG